VRAMSLHQPWASLVAHGLKKIETRGPRPSKRFRGPLLIHAAKKWDQAAWVRIQRAHPNVLAPFLGSTDPFPLGAVVAVAEVMNICEMTAEWIAAQTPLERAVGDWQPGRFGWWLCNVVRLDPAIRLVGRQGLWEPKLASEVSIADMRRIGISALECTAGAVR